MMGTPAPWITVVAAAVGLLVACADGAKSDDLAPLQLKAALDTPFRFFVGSCGGQSPLLSLSTHRTSSRGGGGVVAPTLTSLGEFELGSWNNWNVANPQRPGWLYSVSCTGPGRFCPGPSYVTALKFAVDASGTKVTGKVMSNVTGVGAHPVHMSMSHDNKFLLVAGYDSGTVAAVAIADDDGALGGVQSLSQHSGKSSCDPSTPSGGRQTGPHPHSIVPGPKGSKYYYNADLGLDKVFQYALDASGNLSIVGEVAVAPCSGPRHLAFHPSGKYVYLLHEMASSITLHSVDETSGRLSKALSSLPLVPDSGWRYCSVVPLDGAGNCTKSAEIRVTPDGKYVFASNRGHNSIVKLSLTASGDAFVGAATVVAWVTWVRGMQLTPDGKFLVAASDTHNDLHGTTGTSSREGRAWVAEAEVAPKGGSVIVYEIDQKGKGVLTNVAQVPVPTGCDVTFV